MKAFLYGLVICLAIRSGASYEYAAQCVSGPIVGGLDQTGGRIGLYAIALRTILPVYGNLKWMGKGPNDQCGTAANAINLNLVRYQDIRDHFRNMTQIGALQAMQLADKSGQESYLYVFKSKAFIEYHEIANCVPGGIVKGLSQTGGRIALYTVALQTILPEVFGGLKYLGEGNSSACESSMNTINMGNKSLVEAKQLIANSGMKEVGVLQGMQLAQENKSYLYVFKNKMWNNTWEVMLPNLQTYGLPADFVMTETSEQLV